MESRSYNSPRQALRRTEIMRVARDYLINRDRSEWTMAELAAEAGVARKTLYNIYSSKQDIMQAAALETMTEIGFDTVEEAEPGIDSIVAFSRRTTDQIEETPEFARNIGQTALEAAHQNSLTDYMLGNMIPFHRKHLDVARRSGDLADYCVPERLAHSIGVQGWGEILYWLRGQFALDELGYRTEYGLLTLLVGATRGECQKNLVQRQRNLVNKA